MKSNFHKVYLILLVHFLASGCKTETKKVEEVSKTEIIKELDVLGSYVSDAYSKRNEGYDWVAISVTEKESDRLNISIRSRADKKKPTCTFDAIAKKVDDNVYQTQIDGKSILFQFADGQISIASEKDEYEGLLYFYCSGGASIAGTYLKINEPIDQGQIDKTKFNRILNLQDVGFSVSSIEKDGQNTLTIFTFGLQERDYSETFEIDGEEVINAEVEDLNSDGSPELFVFTQSVARGSYGNVYAFSVNNKKSMSQVYFLPTAENSKINRGYMGQDKFALVENTLDQRFPIYNEGDANTHPTGGIRQVSYKLVEGEAMRKLEVDKVIEY